MTDSEIEKYSSWIAEGKSFSHIREDLLKNGIPEEEAKSIIRIIDNHVSTSQLRKINHNQGVQWITAGTLLTILSIMLFFIGLFPMMFFAATGFASGSGMIVWGINRFQKNNKRDSFKRRTE